MPGHPGNRPPFPSRPSTERSGDGRVTSTDTLDLSCPRPDLGRSHPAFLSGHRDWYAKARAGKGHCLLVSVRAGHVAVEKASDTATPCRSAYMRRPGRGSPPPRSARPVQSWSRLQYPPRSARLPRTSFHAPSPARTARSTAAPLCTPTPKPVKWSYRATLTDPNDIASCCTSDRGKPPSLCRASCS